MSWESWVLKIMELCPNINVLMMNMCKVVISQIQYVFGGKDLLLEWDGSSWMRWE